MNPGVILDLSQLDPGRLPGYVMTKHLYTEATTLGIPGVQDVAILRIKSLNRQGGVPNSGLVNP
jgi:hypothetical protein